MAATTDTTIHDTPQIEDYAIIGDMRTCALVGKNGSIDFLCWPHFDSNSIFTRLLDTENGGGGHWSIRPHEYSVCKQNYKGATNILSTKWIHEDGVVEMTDYFAIDGDPTLSRQFTGISTLMRKVECLRGKLTIDIELDIRLQNGTNPGKYTISQSKASDQPIRQCIYPTTSVTDQDPSFLVQFETNGSKLSPKSKMFKQDPKTKRWLATVELSEHQVFYMAMSDRKWPDELNNFSIDNLYDQTWRFWTTWVRRCTYRGRFQQEVERSLLILKLLTFDETGAIVAAPTFSLPEAIGGGRNWDYRYSWIRDSSFTVYVFLKMGFPLEAEAYMNFIFKQITTWKDRTKMKKHLPLMFGLHGEVDLEEKELPHLGGYRDSKPVRIGNAATEHVQLDIYGELMDAIYLYNKHGKPVSYKQWLDVRDLTNFVCEVWQEEDMSIWEVRGGKKHFTYSKMMLWVAVDRAIRLSEKRNFPCPQRQKWMQTRDQIYEEVMSRGFNEKKNCFVQSYDSDTLDAAVLIAPLVFFIEPNDPQFLSTLEQILESPERGGLTSAGLVFRYNHETVDDGVGGREGTFVMCTLWLVEALIRAGKYDKKWLRIAIDMFENVTNFRNHVGMMSEEIAISGEQLGNTPQAFSHLAFVSATLNLERVMKAYREGRAH